MAWKSIVSLSPYAASSSSWTRSHLTVLYFPSPPSQKKLREIDELRCLMRKVANKEINMKEKEFISNNFNYCQREISTPPEKLPLDSEKDNENYICSSLQPTASEMSEGKDDDERFSFNSKRILIQDSNN